MAFIWACMGELPMIFRRPAVRMFQSYKNRWYLRAIRVSNPGYAHWNNFIDPTHFPLCACRVNRHHGSADPNRALLTVFEKNAGWLPL